MIPQHKYFTLVLQTGNLGFGIKNYILVLLSETHYSWFLSNNKKSGGRWLQVNTQQLKDTQGSAIPMALPS